MERKYIKWMPIAIAIVVLIASCDLFGDKVSISDRVSRFESDINNNLAGVHNHIYPGVTGYDQMRTADYWDVSFPPDDRPFTVSVSGSGNTRSGSIIPTGTVGTRTVDFRFREDGKDNWKIDRIVLASSQIVPAP